MLNRIVRVVRKYDLYPKIQLPSGNRKVVMCVGDSTTFGARYQVKPDKYSYTAFLEKMLNEDACEWEVLNYGLSGRTIDINGDLPYMKEEHYKASLNIHADVIIVMFGLNDIKYCNSIGAHTSLLDSYEDMLREYRNRNPKAVIITMEMILPLKYRYGMSPALWDSVCDSQERLFKTLRREHVIDGTVRTTEVLWKDEHFSKDGVHPSKEGNLVLARKVLDKMKIYLKEATC